MNLVQVDFEEIIDKAFIANGELSKSAIERMLGYQGSDNLFSSPPIVWKVIDILIDLNYKIFIDDEKRQPKPEQVAYLRFYFHKVQGELNINTIAASNRKTT